jgi:DNA-directed RNA polymerase specialized sigma24 family protein
MRTIPDYRQYADEDLAMLVASRLDPPDPSYEVAWLAFHELMQRFRSLHRLVRILRLVREVDRDTVASDIQDEVFQRFRHYQPGGFVSLLVKTAMRRVNDYLRRPANKKRRPFSELELADDSEVGCESEFVQPLRDCLAKLKERDPRMHEFMMLKYINGSQYDIICYNMSIKITEAYRMNHQGKQWLRDCLMSRGAR